MMEKLYNFEKFFESSKKDLKVIYHDIPDEVKKTTLKILRDVFEKIKDPNFYTDGDGRSFVEIIVNDNDFRFIDEDSEIEMDMTPGVKSKRNFDVTLKFEDKFEDENIVLYEITYTDILPEEEIEELEDDEELEDKWYKPDEDDEDVSDEEIDKKIKNKLSNNKSKNFDEFFDESEPVEGDDVWEDDI